MNATEPELISILSQAENQLRQVIAAAAARGDYSGVDVARRVAVGVQEIRERLNTGEPVVSAPILSETATAKTQTAGKSPKIARSIYPRFIVENDTLTKIGWSKKERKEYTHRVSRTTFEQTLQAMLDLANGNNGPFTAEQVIDRLNRLGSDFTPSYQVYIVIALLRKAHCIRQEGRDGYSVFPELATNGRKAWDEARSIR